MKIAINHSLIVFIGTMLIAATASAGKVGTVPSSAVQEISKRPGINVVQDQRLDQHRLICGKLKKDLVEEKRRWQTLANQYTACIDKVKDMEQSGASQAMISLEQVKCDGYWRDIQASVERQGAIHREAVQKDCADIWDSL